MPTITEVMTAFPVHVNEDAPLEQAAVLMEQHHCHHLPVMCGNDVVGLLSREELKLAQTPGHEHEGLEELTAGDLCRRRFASIDLHTRLDIVLSGMADEGLSAVIVMKHDKLAGILTAHDACRFFAQWLRNEYLPDDDPGVA
ncbi:CBS domain-containing protein [Oceanobacter mangrovi]|uniref:CBS domain-containing protein n=1 Tax=Oceanobacter mangrovi TaxID=2862510 RepID=UPI001C8EC5BA|nr:CBS domain-containing protein [Oceanobacter mangrovi]